jgi:polygalacturonase
VAITGEGIIDGAGDAWRPVKRDKFSESQWENLVASGGVVDPAGEVWYPSASSMAGARASDMNVPQGIDTPEQWNGIRDFLRPVMVSFMECDRVLLQGATFRNSPAWNIHPLLCRDVIIKDIIVQNPWYGQNGDGLDLESCDGVLVTGSSFDVGDDAICIKSGKDKQGRDRGRPCRNVIVDDCVVYHGHGGFVVGSEMSGGVNNVSVSNCRFLGTDVGLRFKSQRGRGGVVESIWIRDIAMTNIPTEPLLFDLYYGNKSAVEALEDGDNMQAGLTDAIPEQVNEGTPVFRDIHVRGVVCRGARRAMFFNGLPEMKISGVTVEDCTISAIHGAEICESEGVVLRNVEVHAEDGIALMLNNVNDIQIEDFSCPPSPGAMVVNGSRNKAISIGSGDITPENSIIAPTANGEVAFR